MNQPIYLSSFNWAKTCTYCQQPILKESEGIWLKGSKPPLYFHPSCWEKEKEKYLQPVPQPSKEASGEDKRSPLYSSHFLPDASLIEKAEKGRYALAKKLLNEEFPEWKDCQEAPEILQQQMDRLQSEAWLCLEYFKLERQKNG